MRCHITILLAALAVCACTPLTIYHREGVEVSRMQNDLINCQVEAVEKAPVSPVLRQGPPRYIPGYSRCYGAGSCYRGGGFFVPGEVYSVDVNASLRLQLETQCMASQGYRRVELENCPAGTTAPDGPAQTLVLPPLSENSCAIKGDGGSWKIVDIR